VTDPVEAAYKRFEEAHGFSCRHCKDMSGIEASFFFKAGWTAALREAARVCREQAATWRTEKKYERVLPNRRHRAESAEECAAAIESLLPERVPEPGPGRGEAEA
jgi:hypothetical protein